jgi:hypothetical protein
VRDAVDAERLAQRYRRRIQALLPCADVRLSGSTLLGLLDAHDVDLVVLVEDVATAARILRAEHPPLHEDEWRSDWAAFRDAGPPQVDVVVTVRGSSGDAHHRPAWELLLADARLRAEYADLKATGMTAEQKRAFFQGVVALRDD